MPVIVGASGTGTEGKSDRLGMPTSSSNPSSPSVGDAYFNTTNKIIRIYDGTVWVDVAAGGGQPTDGGNGNGALHANSVSTNATGVTNNTMQQYQGSWIRDAGGSGDLWNYGAGGTGAGNFSVHTGHSGSGGGQWPLWLVIQVSTTTPRVLNQVEWIKHLNACGNVDVYGSNNNITASNYNDENEYTWLGRGHCGGQSSEADGSVKTIHFNHWAWGYKWYALKIVDYNSAVGVNAELHGMLNFPQVGTQGGYAMFSVRLNKVADYINSGFLQTDAFNDSSCKAHYKFESGFEDSTGTANGTAFNGATAGNASEIGANAFLGDNDSGFYSPSSASPLISDMIGGNNEWSVSMWFKIAPGTTTNCSLFHGSRGNDHDRPGAWLRRIDGSNYRIEYFSSSNGSSWNVCKGDVGSGTDARGNLNAITLNDWHHWVWTRTTGGNYKAWIDGHKDFHHTDSTSLYSSGAYAFNWGNWFHSTTNYGFVGNLDNVRFFNKALSETEVMSLYLRHS